MVAEWRRVQAQELFDRLPVGKRYDQWSVLPSGAVPVLDQSPDGVFGYHNDPPGIQASSEEPIVTFSNHRCYVRLITRPFSVIQNVFPLRAKTGVDPYYMYQALRRSVPVTEYKGHWDDFIRLETYLPPVSQQRAIASILGALDDKIDLNRRMNETLEELARTIFKSWFVDFDPVRAKAEGRQPVGMDAETAALFPSRFVESELGEIPEGWEVRTLANVTSKIGSGATPRGGNSVYVEDGVALIRSQNVYDRRFEWPGLARIPDWAAEELRGVAVQPDDVLINITGDSILRTCVVSPAVLPARVNQHVSIVRPVTGVPARFLHEHLLLPRTKDWFLGLDAGGTRKAITKGHLESFRIALPSTVVLSAYDGVSAAMFRRTAHNTEESRTLATLRDLVLPKLISGELRVPDAEKLAEAAL